MNNKKSIVLTLAVLGAILVAFAAWFWLRRHPAPPSEIIVSACRVPAVGTMRLGTPEMHVRFDLPEEGLTSRLVSRDMPPESEYIIARKNQPTDFLAISDGSLPSTDEFKSAFPALSERVIERDIRNSSGLVIGRERWGYLKTGDRWRYFRFAWGAEAGYRPVPRSTARLWDQVIASACSPHE